MLEETHRAAEAALQADIKKLMKAVVAQRTHIETIEKEKIEQNQAIAALEKDLEESKSYKKELEKMKKQRLDLIDKTDDYKEQVKDNEKLQHEITHLTSYFKDG